jgi:hypothetical protein
VIRREFITLLGGAAAAWPLAARAQAAIRNSRSWRFVGREQRHYPAFTKGLAESGFENGRTGLNLSRQPAALLSGLLYA